MAWASRRVCIMFIRLFRVATAAKRLLCAALISERPPSSSFSSPTTCSVIHGQVQKRVDEAVQCVALASARRIHGPKDAGYGRLFKVHVAKTLEKWLLDTDHVEL